MTYESARKVEAWSGYWRWNQALAEEFFSGLFSERPVYLDLNREILGRVAARIGVSPDQATDKLAAAVRPTLSLDGQAGTPFSPQVTVLRKWRKTDMSDPHPCIGLLSLFSIVAETMVSDGEYAGHNYYGRLWTTLGLEDENLKKRTQKSFAEDVPQLWRALNNWLNDWDGALGYPTARALDRRIHVSVPISQAFVREQDRKRLHKMFEDFGLQPGQLVSTGEMALYLGDWLFKPNNSASLQRLWGLGKEEQQRLAEIACSEIEAWEGPEGAADDQRDLGRQAPLRWLAEVYSHPVPSLGLFLAIASNVRGIASSYHIAPGAITNVNARAALAQTGGKARLEPLNGLPWLSLEPWGEISLGDLLLAKLELASESGDGVTLKKEPRAILTLALDDRDAIYKEVPRAQLLQRLTVLCHCKLATKVESHLGKAARPGFNKHNSSTLKGLPEDWVAFLDVEITHAIGDADKELELLVPLGDEEIVAGEGLYLGRETWHAHLLPEVKAAVPGDANFSLEIDSVTQFDGSQVTLTLGPFEGAAAVSLGDHRLCEGNYRVAVKRKGRSSTLTPQSIRVRTANNPRPLVTVKPSKIAHCLGGGSALGLLGAREIDAEIIELSGQMMVRGGTISGEQVVRQCLSLEVAGRFGDAIAFTDSSEDIDAKFRLPGSLRATETGEACVVRGYHYWMVEPAKAGERKKKLMHWECKDCKQEVWVRDHLKKLKVPHALSRARRHNSTQPATQSPAIRKREPVDLDLLLDAASYVGGGLWSRLRALCLVVDDHPWFAAEAARRLSALGHLDLMLDLQTIKFSAWRMAPASLVISDDEVAHLVGARSRKLVDSIMEVASALGIGFERVEIAGAPSTIELTGVSEDAALEIAENCRDPMGSNLELELSFPERLLAGLPPIAALERELPRVTVGAKGAECFDFAAGHWANTRSIDRPGAYRFQWRGLTYAHVTAEDLDARCGRVADSRTVKHLAARRAGLTLAGYNPETQQLLVPFGCELPGLLERVAVLCSGKLPARMPSRHGLIAYENISPKIANGIRARLVAGFESGGGSLELGNLDAVD